jgi:peptidoglycan/xylan/chitin deacetylase (PgdA/CDA1 family)
MRDRQTASVWIAAGIGALVLGFGLGALVVAGVFGSSAHSSVQRTAATPTVAITSTSTTTSTTTTTTTSTTAPLPAPVGIAAGPVAPVFSRIPTNDPVVFFTIDDGIVQDPAVIDYLRAQHVPVTIFPVPAYVHQNPGYFQAIHALGASVQDHTLTHPDLRRLSIAVQQREVCGPLDDYAPLFGARPWLFRPPYGALTPSLPAIARTCGIRAIVTWQATMNDGVLRTQGGPLRPGDIILMHFRTDLRQNLEVALNAARAVGLHPAPLEKYLAAA